MLDLVYGVPLHVTRALASADLLSITMIRACSKLIEDGDACRLALGCELHIMSSQKKKTILIMSHTGVV